MTIELQPSVTPTLSDTVAEEIRALLGRRRISQAALARTLGVSGPWLNYRLTGKQPIDLNDLDAIAKALKVQPSALLTGRRTPTEEYIAPRTPHQVEPGRTRPPARPNGATRPPSGPRGGRRPALLHGNPNG